MPPPRFDTGHPYKRATLGTTQPHPQDWAQITLVGKQLMKPPSLQNSRLGTDHPCKSHYKTTQCQPPPNTRNQDWAQITPVRESLKNHFTYHPTSNPRLGTDNPYKRVIMKVENFHNLPKWQVYLLYICHFGKDGFAPFWGIFLNVTIY